MMMNGEGNIGVEVEKVGTKKEVRKTIKSQE